MSDATTAEPTATEAPATETVTEQVDVDFKAKYEEARGHSREWEKRAKENAEKAKSFDALEEANKTEQQRLAERAETAEKALAAKEFEAERALVALDKGLTAKQASRLVGNTREELLADADQLLEDLGTHPTPSPRADHSQGVKAAAGPQSPRDEFADLIRNRSSR